MGHTITIFQDIHNTTAPFHKGVEHILQRIKIGKSKKLINEIRNSKSKEEKNELKKKLPAICFSGKFYKRSDNALQEHSGIMCLDFDGYKSKKALMVDKESLCKDEYVYSVFISPSGLGLKVLVKVPTDATQHKNYFTALEKYFDNEHFDTTTKNVSRVCYESYDPFIYINENSKLWVKIDNNQYTEVSQSQVINTIPITSENKIVEILLKWWEKKYPMVEGQRNQNTYILASAFNDYGVNKSLAEFVMQRFSTQGFTDREIKQTIDSAYSQTANFKTKFYEDEEKMNNVRVKFSKGKSKSEIKSYLEATELDDKHIDNILKQVEEEDASSIFWTKTDKGKVTIVPFLFKKFLEDNGFYKYNPEGSQNYVFVKVTNNLIDHTTEKEIKDFILEYLIDKDDITIYNYFAEATRFFKEDFLTLLSSISVYFVSDTKDTSYLYYRNCAVKIEKDKLTKIDYIDLGGYVWKDHIINRDFEICGDDDCDYQTFIANICNQDESRITSMRSTIGYMLHGFKNLSFCPAVILNDEVISDDPEGGTGKGLFMNALSHMKKLVVIDGKSFDFAKSFPYQLVSSDTQLLCFDDVRKHFDFEKLFSVVTEGLTLEKKNKDAIKIPFNKSPKISITTNYAIKGKGNSFERRKWELELSQFYTTDYTPLQEFGKLMFGDWSETEWCSFDNYMISCLQLYLAEGLIKSSFVNLKVRRFSAETNHDFIEWCGVLEGTQTHPLLEVGKKIYLNELYFAFTDDNPDYAPRAKMSVSRNKFNKWIMAYGVFSQGVRPEEGRDMKGKWVIIKKKHEYEETAKIDF